MTYEIFNPWVVRSIDSFNFLCCPECVFRSKEKSSFQSHAIENHPKSKVFFSSNQRETQKTGNNLFYCCPECVYKSEDVSAFQIHALEKHPSTSMAFFSKHDTEDDAVIETENVYYTSFAKFMNTWLIYKSVAALGQGTHGPAWPEIS